jgi:hypothetical protein
MRGIVVVSALLGLLGCASEPGTGSSATGLTWVRKADFENRVLYYDARISASPLTAEEMGDTSSAIPVQVTFYEDAAVAWWAPGGEARIGDPAAVVASWPVVENAETASADDIRPGDGSSETETPRVDLGGGLIGIEEAPIHTEIDGVRPELPWAALDWLSDYDDIARLFPHEVPTHPGCL